MLSFPTACIKLLHASYTYLEFLFCLCVFQLTFIIQYVLYFKVCCIYSSTSKSLGAAFGKRFRLFKEICSMPSGIMWSLYNASSLPTFVIWISLAPFACGSCYSIFHLVVTALVVTGVWHHTGIGSYQIWVASWKISVFYSLSLSNIYFLGLFERIVYPDSHNHFSFCHEFWTPVARQFYVPFNVYCWITDSRCG